MDGNNKNGNCDIFCGDPVPIPDYQVGVSMATNGGSTTFRNYPDVAMAAQNVEIFFQGSTTVEGGTSVAAPLWAGFRGTGEPAKRAKRCRPHGLSQPDNL